MYNKNKNSCIMMIIFIKTAGHFCLAVLITIFKLIIMSFVLSIFTTWFYFALFNSSKYMATPGKMLLGLIVVDKEYKRLSFAKATGRFFATFVSSIILFIGFFMAGFTNKKRALHDMMAGTYVIYK